MVSRQMRRLQPTPGLQSGGDARTWLFRMFIMFGIWLVVSTPLKKMSSSVGMILPNIWKHKKCSKPPTRNCHACFAYAHVEKTLTGDSGV